MLNPLKDKKKTYSTLRTLKSLPVRKKRTALIILPPQISLPVGQSEVYQSVIWKVEIEINSLITECMRVDLEVKGQRL